MNEENLHYGIFIDEEGRVTEHHCYTADEPDMEYDAILDSFPTEHLYYDYIYKDGQLIYKRKPTKEEELESKLRLANAQIAALEARGEFMEDCMAEMAMMVYA